MAKVKVRLREICHARSGDKANKSNIGLIANDRKYYATLVEQVTAERVKEHFAELIKGRVERYEMENIKALNFVAYDALDGGGAAALRIDNQGKCNGANLLRMVIEIDEDLLESK